MSLDFEPEQPLGDLVGEPGVFQAENHDVEADGEPDHLPGGGFDGHPGFGRLVFRGDGKKDQGTSQGEEANRKMVEIPDEISEEQQSQKPPADAEHLPIFDDAGGFGQQLHIDMPGDGLSEKEPKHGDGGQDRKQVGQEHRLHIFDETDAEIVGGDDVGEVGDDQGVGGAVADEAPGHQKGEDRFGVHLEIAHLGQEDRGEDQRRPVVGEKGGHQSPEEENTEKHQMPAASAQMCHLDRRPFEKADLIEYHGEEDNPDEGQSGVPDDKGHFPNILPGDHAQEKSGDRPAYGGGPDGEPPGLPDDEDECYQKEAESE